MSPFGPDDRSCLGDYWDRSEERSQEVVVLGGRQQGRPVVVELQRSVHQTGHRPPVAPTRRGTRCPAQRVHALARTSHLLPVIRRRDQVVKRPVVRCVQVFRPATVTGQSSGRRHRGRDRLALQVVMEPPDAGDHWLEQATGHALVNRCRDGLGFCLGDGRHTGRVKWMRIQCCQL